MAHQQTRLSEDLGVGLPASADAYDPLRVGELKERASRLNSPEECEQLAINVEERGFAEVALAARIRSAKLRAAKQHPASDVEREALESLYLYQHLLSGCDGNLAQQWRACRDIKRRGILPVVEQLLGRKPDRALNAFLKSADPELREMALEAVVLRHPEAFSADAVKTSKRRLRASSRISRTFNGGIA